MGAALLLLVSSCSDDGTPPVDAASDTSIGDIARTETSPADTAPDTWTADSSTTDGPAVDTSPPDAVKTDTTDPKCAAVTCGVMNDCCNCKAYQTNIGPLPPPCNITNCKQPTCGAIGLKNPQTYCIKGSCYITAGATSCASDSDCRRVNTCCDCLAVPKAVLDPPCKISSCLLSACASRGLDKAGLKCVLGMCKLVP